MRVPDDRQSRESSPAEISGDEVRFLASSVSGPGRRGPSIVTSLIDALGRPSAWGQSLSIFDAQDGRLIQQWGDMMTTTGEGISLVWPPPSS